MGSHLAQTLLRRVLHANLYFLLDGLLGVPNPFWQFDFVQFQYRRLEEPFSIFGTRTPRIHVAHKTPRSTSRFSSPTRFRLGVRLPSEPVVQGKSVNPAALLIQLVGALPDAPFDVARNVRLP